jgi:hypothetical protein
MSAFSDIPKTNGRRFPGIKGRAPHKKDCRRAVARVVAAKRADRSARQQLAELDRLLGTGVGATKERARLRRQP